MNKLLKLEELGQLFLGIFFFKILDYNWWWFAGLFFMPDISIAAYLINNKVGAWVYNLFHHKGIAALFILLGYVLFLNPLSLVGAIMLAHSAFDRILGYGLKYESDFKNTHLGTINFSKKS